MALKHKGGRQEEDQLKRVLRVAWVHREVVNRLCHCSRAEFKTCLKCFSSAWYHFYL